MIGRLTGKLVGKHPPQVLVDIGGVGYEVDVPMSTFYALPGTGETVTLFTHLSIKEDAHVLYGFASLEERGAFRQLIRISGVGPRTALSVLSGLSVAELSQAVALQDAARLTKIPGIGKKTAERIVLELKDRLADIAQPASADGTDRPQIDHVRDDLVSALENLGYHRPLAEKAVDATLSSASAPTFEQALKAALRELMR